VFACAIQARRLHHEKDNTNETASCRQPREQANQQMVDRLIAEGSLCRQLPGYVLRAS